MPNRILRDWTDSKAINDISWQCEVLFTRLIMKADDYGNFYADSFMIKSLLFPRKDGLRVSDIDGWLKSLEAARLIRFYPAKGETFLHIANFKQRLRQKRRQYPEPPAEIERDSDMTATCPPETKRNESEVEVETNYTRPRDFLKDVNEREFEEIQMKSGLNGEFENCTEQWSLTIEGSDFEYSTDQSKDYRKLKALFQKWINTWNSNNSKKVKTGADKASRGGIDSRLDINQLAKDGVSND